MTAAPLVRPAFAAPFALLPPRAPPSAASPPRASPLRVRRPRASIIPERPPDGYKDTCPFGSASNEYEAAAERMRQRDVAARAAARAAAAAAAAASGSDAGVSREVPPPPPPLFVDDKRDRPFWASVDEVLATTATPITPEDADALRRVLPRRLANFLLDRAADAARLRDEGPAPDDNSFVARVLRDLPPDAPDWADDSNWEYANYQYATAVGPPSFRRRGSSLFGGGDGLPDPDPDGYIGAPHDVADDVAQGRPPLVGPDDPPTRQARRVSLFVGQSGSVGEQASRVGYAIMAVLALWIFIKLLFALVSFFVSFTFSFFAIFALSAGIFVVFVFFRF